MGTRKARDEIRGDSGLPSNTPVVSVAFITYQHGPFVRQALESVLAQQAEFTFEVVIGEDGSTDGTLAICTEFQERFPGKVRLFQHGALPKVSVRGRLTGRMNLMRTLMECRGQFIALLEGDDWWTDPQKLQRQVDDLRANPKAAFSFHDVNRVGSDGVSLGRISSNQVDHSTLDLLRSFPAQTASLLFRRSALPIPFPNWLLVESPVADQTLMVLASIHGPGRRVPACMAAYRIGTGGWTTRAASERSRDNVLLFNLLARELPPSYQSACMAMAQRSQMQLVRTLVADGRVAEARDEWMLVRRPSASRSAIRDWIVTRAAVSLPNVVSRSVARWRSRGRSGA